MKFKDNSTLGVERDTRVDESKLLCRRLARKFHPDVSDEPDAEEPFKAFVAVHGSFADSSVEGAQSDPGPAGELAARSARARPVPGDRTATPRASVGEKCRGEDVNSESLKGCGTARSSARSISRSIASAMCRSADSTPRDFRNQPHSRSACDRNAVHASDFPSSQFVDEKKHVDNWPQVPNCTNAPSMIDMARSGDWGIGRPSSRRPFERASDRTAGTKGNR